MKNLAFISLFLILSPSILAQQNRIAVNNQEIWFNGGNVAWVNFAQDVGPASFPENDFQAMFDQVRENGGNAMRFWLHITGANTPAWNGNEITGPGQGTIEDLERLLDMGEENGVGLILCLWSFDMMRTSNGNTIVNRSKALLESAELTQTYIDNALTPMVDALGNHPALLSWEIFNEPEGMSNEFGWNFTTHTSMANIQRFVNQTTGAIHRANPNALVSNGSWSFHALANTSSGNSKNYYSDNELISAGGDSLGTLDYYMVHYYDWGGTELSPFHNTKDSWGLDKPVVVGEFGIPANDLFGIPADSLYERLYDNGYAGALVWQWVDWYQNRGSYGPSWLRGLEQMQNMQNKYPSDINLKFDNPRVRFFDASLTEIEAGGQTELSWEVRNASEVTLDGEPVDSIGSLVVSPTETTLYTLIGFGIEAANDTSILEIKVLPAGLINRAEDKSSRSSTFETCCGTSRLPSLAFDGDNNTRWSSAWSDGIGDNPAEPNTDEDPDDEWIDVDLDKAIEVSSVLLNWEAAHASNYQLQTSLDGINWKTVFTDAAADGGVDSIVFNDPELAKFVRMQGVERATEFGYSLWEFEVRGAVSILQPPSISITSPVDGKGVESGKSFLIEVSASDDREVQAVYFFMNDDSLGMDTSAPYTFTVPGIELGEQTIYVKARDNDGLVVQSESIIVEGRADILSVRLEAEEATLTGATSAQPGMSGASKGNAVYMEGSGSISWDNLTIPQGDNVEITVRYWLPFDYKENFLSLNGERIDTMAFNTPIESWQDLKISRSMNEPIESLSIDHYWGYMTFDYVDVSVEGISVSSESEFELPESLILYQNYPNPFNPTTVISYSIPQASSVNLSIYSLNGQKVVDLISEKQQAGEYSVTWDASNLASGVYFSRLQVGNSIQTRKMILIK